MFICLLVFLMFFYLRSWPILILVIKYYCETRSNHYCLTSDASGKQEVRLMASPM